MTLYRLLRARIERHRAQARWERAADDAAAARQLLYEGKMR